MTITADDARELFIYEPETGLLKWRNNAGRWGLIPAGTVVGYVAKLGYVQFVFRGHKYSVGPVAWLYVTGKWPAALIDHKDGNPNNNRWDNLREATHMQNMWNAKLSARNTTGYQGIYFDKRINRWSARIQVDRKQTYLGSFSNAEAAAEAYRQRAIKYRGEFARLA